MKLKQKQGRFVSLSGLGKQWRRDRGVPEEVALPRCISVMLLLCLAAPAWAKTPGPTTVGPGCGGAQNNTACARLSPGYLTLPAAAGSAPLSTGSAIGIAASSSESTSVKMIPHATVSGTSQGSGGHQAGASLTGPGTAAAGGYTQSAADVKTSLFHLGYTTRITTDSSNRVQDYSWATTTSTGSGKTTLSTTSNANSATAASVTAGGITAASSGRAVSTATANAAFNGPGTATVSALAWSNSSSHAQVVLNQGTPVSSSAGTINQTGGYSQANISSPSAMQSSVNGSPASSVTGAANISGAGSSITSHIGATGQPAAAPASGIAPAAPQPGALGAGLVTQTIMSGKGVSAGTAKGK